MTLDELKTEEAKAAQALMAFNFDGTWDNTIRLVAIIYELRGIRRTISLGEWEQWKNEQCLRNGMNVDDYIDVSDEKEIFLRKIPS